MLQVHTSNKKVHTSKDFQKMLCIYQENLETFNTKTKQDC